MAGWLNCRLARYKEEEKEKEDGFSRADYVRTYLLRPECKLLLKETGSKAFESWVSYYYFFAIKLCAVPWKQTCRGEAEKVRKKKTPALF